MSLYIGIEGLGLKHSVAVASDAAGRIVAACRMHGEPISLHTTERHVLQTRLNALICEISAQAGRTVSELSDAVVCVGLTGVTFRYDAEVDLPREFEQLGIKVAQLICTGDAEIIFASHALADTGSAIVCHMGSTAYVTTPTGRVRFGGWGPALGDEGSGYWIGKAVLRAIGEEHDSGAPPSELWNAIDSWLGGPDSEDIPDWTGASFLWRKRRAEFDRGDEQSPYDPRTAVFAFSHAMSLQKHWQWRAVVSGLTIPVMRAWQAGNQVAGSICEKAADHLVRQYGGACRRARVSSALGPLVLYGGGVAYNQQFRDCVIEKLKNEGLLPDRVLLPFSAGTMRPACGALLFALGRSETGQLRLPPQDLICAVADQADKYRSGDLKND